MGLFSKKKSDDQEKIGLKGMPVNPKILGGPSTTALSPDDPMLQPVDGISLADYAAVARECQARKITDEAGMNQVATEMGFDAAAFGPAIKEWIARMGKSMVVGQEFRRYLGY
jgi:hypothetical protein